MKILIDENISYRIKYLLNDIELIHVNDSSLDLLTDKQIWDHAKENDYLILSLDNVFIHFSNLFGSPPKLVFISYQNPSNQKVADLIKSSINKIQEFSKSDNNLLII